MSVVVNGPDFRLHPIARILAHGNGWVLCHFAAVPIRAANDPIQPQNPPAAPVPL